MDGHVLQGDLGTSFRTRREITEELSLRLPVTIQLALMAATMAITAAIPVGVLAAVRRNSKVDYAATIGTLIGISMPNFLWQPSWCSSFVQAEMASSDRLRSFREDPVANLKVMIMPSVSLALRSRPCSCATPARPCSKRCRTTMSAGGQGEGTGQSHGHDPPCAAQRIDPDHNGHRHPVRDVARRHRDHRVDLRLPGIGRYIYESISARDYPVVLGVTLVIATLFVLISLCVEIVYAIMDPRLRHR